MTRLLLLLVMALTQAQPLAAALLCESHHTGAERTCMAEEHAMQTTDHHQGEHGTGHPAQQPDHGCASMTACTTAVPVMVTSGVTTVTALVIFNSPTISPSQQPPTVGAPPPFHPPKA